MVRVALHYEWLEEIADESPWGQFLASPHTLDTVTLVNVIADILMLTF